MVGGKHVLSRQLCIVNLFALYRFMQFLCGSVSLSSFWHLVPVMPRLLCLAVAALRRSMAESFFFLIHALHEHIVMTWISHAVKKIICENNSAFGRANCQK